MRLLLINLLVLTTTILSLPQDSTLHNHFADIMALIPTENIKSVISKTDLKKEIAYFKSRRFLTYSAWILMQEEVFDVLSFLNKHGVKFRFPGIDLVECAEDCQGIEELLKLIPFFEIYNMIEDKKKCCPVFNEYWELVTSEKMNNFTNYVLAHPEYKAFKVAMSASNFDVEGLVSLIYEYLGWNYYENEC